MVVVVIEWTAVLEWGLSLFLLDFVAVLGV
jgi:hypothetical protein